MIALRFACLVNTEPNRKTALRRADLGLVEGVPSEKRVTILQADRVEKLLPQLTPAGARDYDPRQGPIEQAPQSGGTRTVDVLPAPLQAVSAVGCPASMCARVLRCHS